MTTANMSLTLPTPTITTGPLWANELNSNLSLIDAHDHTTGKGMLVPVAGLDINDNLPMGSAYGIEQARYVRLAPVNGAVPDTSLFRLSINGNLYYNNDSGIPVQITNGNSIASPVNGGFSGLSAPAAAIYSGGSFELWADQPGDVPGSLLCGPIATRRAVAGSAVLTLTPSASMSSGYTWTWPPSVPASSSVLSMDAAGVVTNVLPDGTTVEIASSTLRVKPLGIDTAQIADSAVETVKINDAAVTLPKLANFSLVRSSGSGTWTNGGLAITGPTAIPNLSVTITSGSAYRPIFIGLLPDDGLGAGGFAKITANHSMRVFLQVTSGSPPTVHYNVTTLLASTGLSPPASIQGIYPTPSAGVLYTVTAYVDVGTGSNPTPDIAGLILFAYQA